MSFNEKGVGALEEDKCPYLAADILKKLAVFRSCGFCNKSYELQLDRHGVHNFANCPHCGERNDVWIIVKQKPGESRC